MSAVPFHESRIFDVFFHEFFVLATGKVNGELWALTSFFGKWALEECRRYFLKVSFEPVLVIFNHVMGKGSLFVIDTGPRSIACPCPFRVVEGPSFWIVEIHPVLDDLWAVWVADEYDAGIEDAVPDWAVRTVQEALVGILIENVFDFGVMIMDARIGVEHEDGIVVSRIKDFLQHADLGPVGWQVSVGISS